MIEVIVEVTLEVDAEDKWTLIDIEEAVRKALDHMPEAPYIDHKDIQVTQSTGAELAAE